MGELAGASVHAGDPGDAAGFAVAPTLVETSTAALRADGSPLLEECFGPVGVLGRYRDEADLLETLGRMEGSLTASVHVGAGETALPARILVVAQSFAGRVLVNGYPTGVAVNWSMMHGGPWPASTNAGHTSVGATSIRRFLRPVAFQNVPDGLLPDELRDANPLHLPRRTVTH
jgi:NADP-dependent aldehyde dehydrogenase